MKQSSTIAITSAESQKSPHGVTNPLGIRVDDQGRFDRAAEKRLTRLLHWINGRFLSDGFKV